MEECLGKTLLEEKMKSLLENDDKINVGGNKVLNELKKKLQETFCCVTFPVKKKYFSWRHLKFKKKIEFRTIELEEDNYSSEHKILRIIFQTSPNSLKIELNIFTTFGKNDEVVCRIRLHGDAHTDVQIIDAVVDEIAKYTFEFNKENNVK